MAILVTGAPGSGKTSLVEFAHTQGNTEFIDADVLPNLCEWREFATGNVVGDTTSVTSNNDDAWYEKYGWYWKSSILKDYLLAHPDVVFCGSAENMCNFYHLFSEVIFLKKSFIELVQNLTNPNRTNPYGKTQKQRENLLHWQDYIISKADIHNTHILTGNTITTLYRQIVDLVEK